MKYKCRGCEHEFEGLSFINKCEKCGSDNIFRKAQKSSNTIWIILLIIIVILGGVLYYFFTDTDTDTDNGENKKPSTYSSIFHTIENSNEIHFFLVINKDANVSDTVDYDSHEHNWLNLEITQGTRKYNLEENTLYPCNAEAIRYAWDNTGLMKTDKPYKYIDKTEFSEGFTVSNKAECPVEWKITNVSPRLDEDCNFTVYTDHPENQPEELDESFKGTLRSEGLSESDIEEFNNWNSDSPYYTKGKKIIKISISGENGPYEFRNKWKFERGMKLSIWAVATDSPNDKKRYDMPVYFDTACFVQVDSVAEEGVESEVVVAGEIEETIDYSALNEKKRQEVISHYSGILNDVENNWDRVYKFSGDVVLNGNTQKSFPRDVMSAIDDGKRVVVRNVICIKGKVIKVILEIK